MAVLNVQWPQTGQVPNTTTTSSATTLPSIIFIQTNDTLATATVAGYLNKSVSTFGNVYNNSQMALVYTTDSGDVWLRVSVTTVAGVTTYSLVTPTEGSGTFSSIVLNAGTAAAPALSFTGDTDTGIYRVAANTVGIAGNGALIAAFATTGLAVTGLISASTSITASGGALTSGSVAGGSAGSLILFSNTAANGSLRLLTVGNSGNFAATISDVSTLGQASVYTLPDPANAVARILVGATATPFVSGNLVKASGTGGLMVDAGFAVKANTTASYAGGGTSNAFTATGLTTSSIVTAVILTSTNSVAITKAVPTSNTLTITFSADPGASTTVSWIAITPAV